MRLSRMMKWDFDSDGRCFEVLLSPFSHAPLARETRWFAKLGFRGLLSRFLIGALSGCKWIFVDIFPGKVSSTKPMSKMVYYSQI